MPFTFDNTYARLPDAFFKRIAPTRVSAPVTIRLNHGLATELSTLPDWILRKVSPSSPATNRRTDPILWPWRIPDTSLVDFLRNSVTVALFCWVRSSATTVSAVIFS